MFNLLLSPLTSALSVHFIVVEVVPTPSSRAMFLRYSAFLPSGNGYGDDFA